MTWRIWGEGPPALLIHGTSGSWTHWIRNIEALSARRTLYVPDLPGHGDSDAPPMPPSMVQFAELLWQGLDMLLPADTVLDVLGFSLGSLLAECMAMQRPERVQNIVLLRGGFGPTAADLPDTLKRWRHIEDEAEMADVQRHNLAQLMFHDPSRIDDLAIHTHTRNLQRCSLNVKPLLGSRPADVFGQLRGRIHGVSGEFDVYGGGDVSAHGRTLLRVHPDATFHLVPNAGHWAIYEAADKVNAILAKVLA